MVTVDVTAIDILESDIFMVTAGFIFVQFLNGLGIFMFS